MVGQIVCSKSGRDKDYFMVVVSYENGFYFVCDGKERPLERPKKKNALHLSLTGTYLNQDDYKTNRQLRKALAVYRSTASQKEEL
jgi:ribosomal protein L14E/L6E/L27E